MHITSDPLIFSNHAIEAGEVINAISAFFLLINFAILVQSVKSVPKNIRMNCSVFQLATFKNKKVVLEDMYEEISNVLTLEEFEKLYDHATDKQYGCLFLDLTNGKRFYQSLDNELFIKN